MSWTSIRTMPRSRARRRMLSSSGPVKIPGKSVKTSNRSRGLCAAVSDSDTNHVFVRLPRAQGHEDLRRGFFQGCEDEIGLDRWILGLRLVSSQPDRSHAGATGARDVEAERVADVDHALRSRSEQLRRMNVEFSARLVEPGAGR